jgi:lipid-A-disaccharide synthase-like uncharacterized protein
MGLKHCLGPGFSYSCGRVKKTGKVQSPSIFWQVSLLASVLLLIYSILVKDIPIMLGQLIGYFIYIRNLMLEKVWRQFPKLLRLIIIALPALAIFIIFSGPKHDLYDLIENNSNTYLLIWGLTGQLVFTSRFIYQWLYSEIKKQSVFPLGFWILSIAGAVLISSYAFYLHLYPIIIGHAIGMLVYVRNLMIHFNFLTRKVLLHLIQIRTMIFNSFNLIF